MMRPFAFRVCLLAFLVIPALAILGSGVEAQAPGWRLEKSWKCLRCGGYLGNGHSRPTYCHHCDAKRNSSGGKSAKSEGLPAAGIAIGGVVILAAAGLGFYLLTSSGTPPNRAGIR